MRTGTGARGHGARLGLGRGGNQGRDAPAWFPDDDVRLAVLTNEFTTDVNRIVHDLVQQVF
jgi:hypothetical protein